MCFSLKMNTVRDSMVLADISSVCSWLFMAKKNEMALRTQCFDGFMRKIKNNFCALYVFGGRAKRPNFSSRQKGVGGNRVETQNVALDHISKRKGAVCIGARLLVCLFDRPQKK